MKNLKFIKKWVPRTVLEEAAQFSSIIPGTSLPRLYKYCALTQSNNKHPENLKYSDYINCPEDLENYEIYEIPGIYTDDQENSPEFIKQLKELGLV